MYSAYSLRASIRVNRDAHAHFPKREDDSTWRLLMGGEGWSEEKQVWRSNKGEDLMQLKGHLLAILYKAMRLCFCTCAAEVRREGFEVN